MLQKIHSRCRRSPLVKTKYTAGPHSEFVQKRVTKVWLLLKGLSVEGLYCKRPIQCLASSEILTPTPSPPAFGGWVGGGGWVRTHSLGGEGVGVQHFGRGQTKLLCTLYIITLWAWGSIHSHETTEEAASGNLFWPEWRERILKDGGHKSREDIFNERWVALEKDRWLWWVAISNTVSQPSPKWT